MKLQEVMIDGRKPVNPIGTCFDSSAHVLLNLGSNFKMCHGIGVSNLPGEPADFMAHAWLEFTHEGIPAALDTTWMIAQRAKKYRKDLKLNYVVIYEFKEFVELWARRGFPGPYDPKIAALTKEGKKRAEEEKWNSQKQ